MSNPVTIGRIVIYTSRTGDYVMPAIVSATKSTLFQPNVEAGNIPDCSSDEHVHLAVFTAGTPGKRREALDFKVESEHPVSENVAGTYQEWDIPHDASGEPGTWCWPHQADL